MAFYYYSNQARDPLAYHPNINGIPVIHREFHVFGSGMPAGQFLQASYNTPQNYPPQLVSYQSPFMQVQKQSSPSFVVVQNQKPPQQFVAQSRYASPMTLTIGMPQKQKVGIDYKQDSRGCHYKITRYSDGTSTTTRQ